ncbi:MAG: hypothetical protein ACYDHZ_00445 [Dehalococcoidia bacterium]
MSDNSGNYLAGMLQAGNNPGVDVIGNLNKGMQFGQNVQNIPAQNMFRQQEMAEMQKKKQLDAAIKQYGQTGDIKAIESIDPGMAAKVAKSHEYLSSLPPESMKDMKGAMDMAQQLAPMITAENWPKTRSRLMAAFPKLDPTDLPPENATDAQLYQWKYAVPIFQATIEGLKKGPKVLKPNDILMGPQGPIYQAPPAPMTEKDKSIIERNRALIGKYGADIELKVKDLAIKQAHLDFEKTKPGKGGGTYNEAAAYDKAVTAANKVLTDSNVVRDAVNKRLAEQDPKWSKRTSEEKGIARQKIMPQVREELKKHLIDSYMNERRQKAGATGGGKGAPAKGLQSMSTEELRQAIQRAETGEEEE